MLLVFVILFTYTRCPCSYVNVFPCICFNISSFALVLVYTHVVVPVLVPVLMFIPIVIPCLDFFCIKLNLVQLSLSEDHSKSKILIVLNRLSHDLIFFLSVLKRTSCA